MQHGFDYFILVDRDTDKRTRTYATSDAVPARALTAIGAPSWRYHRPGFGWRS